MVFGPFQEGGVYIPPLKQGVLTPKFDKSRVSKFWVTTSTVKWEGGVGLPEKIVELWDTSIETIDAITTKNFQKLFTC